MDKEELLDFVGRSTGRCSLLVIGDVMLDAYYYGEVTRISPEAPVPVAHVLHMKETLGGASNVAHNLALLGCRTSIAGFIGDDHHGRTLHEKLAACGIEDDGLIRTNQPTTTKMRVIGGHQQMLRLDFEETKPPEDAYVHELLSYVKQKLACSLDAIILSDYGKGTLTDHTCCRIIEMAHAQGVPVVIDPKGTNWGKYAHADYITPNLKEINAVLLEPIRNLNGAVEQASHYVMRKFHLKNVLCTRSEAGLSLVTPQKVTHIPTRAQEVYDVSGAGDTVIAVFALGLAGGLSEEACAFLANLAASVVVAKLGTYAVSREELLEALRQLPAQEA